MAPRGVVGGSVGCAGVGSAADHPRTPTTRRSQHLEPNPVLDRARRRLEHHRWKPAHDLLVPWLKTHPSAPDRDRALFLLAEVYYQSGDRMRAFYHLDEMLDNYPESRLFFPCWSCNTRSPTRT